MGCQEIPNRSRSRNKALILDPKIRTGNWECSSSSPALTASHYRPIWGKGVSIHLVKRQSLSVRLTVTASIHALAEGHRQMKINSSNLVGED